MPTILVIQHVPHEGLGTFGPVLKEAGCRLVACNASARRVVWPSLEGVDGLIVMGGPQSVYEQARYPFLKRELELLQQALKDGRPILGVCLGSQLLARALGATVKKIPQKEIGWFPLMRESAADCDPLFTPFGPTETVFQWHGDTFTLPKGAIRLASSPLCREQAFRYGANAYGLQFHLEVTGAMIRAWLRVPANRAELSSLCGVIDPAAILRQNRQHLGRLRELSQHVAKAFASSVRPAMPTRRKVHARTV